MEILIDIGSSTVKVYSYSAQEGVVPLETKSIHFREGFTPDQGIAPENKQALIAYINTIKQKYSPDIHVYATAIFRKFFDEPRRLFASEFKQHTGIPFTIVPHDQEGRYLELALAGKYHAPTPTLLINIGGGSTELITIQDSQAVQHHNLEIGVMTVMQQFPQLNDPLSPYPLDDVVSFIKNMLPQTTSRAPVAIYNGGELTNMQLADYPLQPNTLFEDVDHPSMISVQDFATRNQQIFDKVPLSSLEALMPSDPLWMHGARPCSAIAQAICVHFCVETIVPSDSNMVHGIVRHELQKLA